MSLSITTSSITTSSITTSSDTTSSITTSSITTSSITTSSITTSNDRHEEHQYLDLIRDILEKGTLEKGRNGNTVSVFGRSMRFSLEGGQIPILTTKQVAWKTCAKELFWFLSGSTDNRILQQQNVGIWNDNATRAYLDSRGLTDYDENELGPIYGYQWRHFGAPYRSRKEKTQTTDNEEENNGIDQIQQIIDTLNDPAQRTSRRIILTAWNPAQLDEMALPPCHMFAQFNVRNGTHLSCAMYQRSGDVGLGVPFNIASYSLLTHLLAFHTGLVAEEFVYFLGNAHIYEEHIEALRTQLDRVPFPFPRISIQPKPGDIDLAKQKQIDEYTLENIVFETPYQYHTSIKMKMKA